MNDTYCLTVYTYKVLCNLLGLFILYNLCLGGLTGRAVVLCIVNIIYPSTLNIIDQILNFLKSIQAAHAAMRVHVIYM